MSNKIQQVFFAGVVATIVMTLMMVIGGAMGMPKMSPPDMLAGMMGVPVIIGWVLHFMIGIIFAAGYVFLFNNWLRKINPNILRGALYGMIAFVVAQMAIPLMATIFGSGNMPAQDGSMVLMVIGSAMGHILFGMVIALIAKSPSKSVKTAIG